AKILGHSNTNMTRHYTKFSEQLIGREMRKMNERMFSGDILTLNQ
ncbi:MAG: site-specific integrase, partial [Alistipes sp.]|nr:site-specific integrase [Alistipes sp.]